jgi:hypothetical protein
MEIPMAKKPRLLADLFHDTLKDDVYFAENKILKTLPKMATAAQSKDLKAAFPPPAITFISAWSSLSIR